MRTFTEWTSILTTKLCTLDFTDGSILKVVNYAAVCVFVKYKQLTRTRILWPNHVIDFIIFLNSNFEISLNVIDFYFFKKLDSNKSWVGWELKKWWVWYFIFLFDSYYGVIFEVKIWGIFDLMLNCMITVIFWPVTVARYLKEGEKIGVIADCVTLLNYMYE